MVTIVTTMRIISNCGKGVVTCRINVQNNPQLSDIFTNNMDAFLRGRFSYGAALSLDAGDDQQVGEQKHRSFFAVHRLPGNDGHQVVSEECSVSGRQVYQPINERLYLLQFQIVLFGAVDFHRHFVHLFLRFDQRLVVWVRRFGVFQQSLKKRQCKIVEN